MMHEFRPDAVKEVAVNAHTHGGVVTFLTSVVAIALGAAPLLFLPHSFVMLSHSKVLLVGVLLLLLSISGLLLTLTRKVLPLRMSAGVLAISAVGVATILAALVADSPVRALMGTNLPPHAAVTVLVAVAAGIAAFIFAKRQRYLSIFFAVSIVSGMLLHVFTISKIFLAALFDSSVLGTFASLTATPIGSWNSLGMYTVLQMLLVVLSLIMLPLRTFARNVLYIAAGLALCTLLLVNVTLLWMLLVLVAGGLLFYLYTDGGSAVAWPVRMVVGVAILLAVCMLFFGSLVSGVLPAAWQVPYMEIYPSLSSTKAVALSVLREQPLLGAGPSYFAAAWDAFKTPEIYQTDFWDTPFQTGVSYFGTTVVETGLVGVLSWLLLIGCFVAAMIRVVRTDLPEDSMSRFVLTASMISALYLLIVTTIFNISVAILLLLFAFLGIFFSVAHMQAGGSVIRIRTPQVGLARLGVFAVLTAGSLAAVGAMVFLGNHYLAVATTNKALAYESDLLAAEQALVSSYNRFADSEIAFTLAQLELTRMQSVLVAEPSEDQIAVFQDAAAKATDAIGLAVSTDPQNAVYNRAQAVILLTMRRAGFLEFDEAIDRALAASELASPQHPTNALLRAEYALLRGDTAEADAAVAAALHVRPNHFPAYNLSLQRSLDENDTDAAVATLASLASWYPKNQYLLYDMGLLVLRLGRPDDATVFLQQAVRVDPQYADAKYVLALIYAQAGKQADALALLESLRAENTDNERLAQTIAAVQAGAAITASSTETITDTELLLDEESTIVPDGEVVTTPNTVPETESEI